jgi:Helix-turn-helix domain
MTMSVQAISWAFAVELPDPPRGLSKVAMRMALVALANYADQDNAAWPKMKRLEVDTCMSVSRLQRAFATLETAGLLKREVRRRANGSRTSNRYVLHATGHRDTLLVPGQQVTVTGPDPSLSSEPSPISELSLATREKMGKPNPIFDALAELHGGTEKLSRPMAKTVGVATAAIRRATPNVNAGEIHRRARNYTWLSWNDQRRAPSAQALAKWWADCDTDPPVDARYDPAPPLTEEDWQRAIEASDKATGRHG